MKVRNYMEDAVEMLLPDILNGYDELCCCEECLNDIKAIALNNLPPKYVATEKGRVLSKANVFTIQSEVDVTKAIIDAIDKVIKLPRHETVI